MHFIDKRIVSKLVADGIAAGYSVSVNDGEDFTVTRSRDKATILAALESTDEDFLHFGTAERQAGWAHLVHGNEPGVIISDHTDTPEFNALVAPAMALADKLGA